MQIRKFENYFSQNYEKIYHEEVESQALSYAVGFCQSKTAILDWTFFRLDSSGPSSYRQSSRF